MNENKPIKINLLEITENNYVINWNLPTYTGYKTEVWRSEDPLNNFAFFKTVEENKTSTSILAEETIFFYKVLTKNISTGELSELSDDYIKVKLTQFKIIPLNSDNYDVEFFKEIFFNIAGGDGIINGFELDQNDWKNNSTDKIIVSPGSYIWYGEINRVNKSIEINNIFSKTTDGDFLFFVNRTINSEISGVQIGYGKAVGDVLIFAKRIGDYFHRVSTIMKNIDFHSNDAYDVENNKDNFNISFKRRKKYDGSIVADGSQKFDGRFKE